MASNQTANFGLSQWAATDSVLREEFNADNLKIDGAIPKIVAGEYVGDGAETRIIPLEFTPKLVYVCDELGRTYSYSGNYVFYLGGLALPGKPVLGYNQEAVLTITAGGFQVIRKEYCPGGVGGQYNRTNQTDSKYRYFAIG